MFLTRDFIVKYTNRSEMINIDGIQLCDLSHVALMAVTAYFYDMYMKVHEHVPTEELFTEGASLKRGEGASGEAPSNYERVTNG